MNENDPAAQESTVTAGVPAPDAQEAREGDPLDAIVIADGRADRNDAGKGFLDGGAGADDVPAAAGEDAGAPGDAAPEGGYAPFAIPEGLVADQEAMEEFGRVAGRHGLRQDQAQELVSLYTGMEQKRASEQAEFIARNDAAWSREIRENAEFGGANLKASSERVSALVRKYGSPRLTEQMRQMNLQNWPELFYMLARVQNAAAEDSSPGGAGGSRELTAEDYYRK